MDEELAVKEEYNGQERRPLNGWKMSDYLQKALVVIKETYPEATEDDFSDVYGLAYMNEELIFASKASSWEYPGCWYAGTLIISNDEFVNLLIEDGLLFLQKKRPKFSNNNYKDF